MRVWRLADSRERLQRAMAPIHRYHRQQAGKRPWFDPACDVWLDDVHTGNRLPKVSGGQALEGSGKEGGCWSANTIPIRAGSQPVCMP